MADQVKQTRDPVVIREEYVSSWNALMVTIWKEQITKLGIVDTGALYNSVIALPVQANGQFTELSIVHEFNLYGVFQDRGTGRETPKGNGGDIERRKVRQPRLWLSRRYYSSVCNIRDFMADSIGMDFIGAVATTLENVRT